MQNIQHLIKSGTLKSYYKDWLKSATVENILHVDKVYLLCEKNYSGGGDQVIECMNPAEVLEELPTLKEVKEYCGIRVDAAMNARFGDHDDSELKYAENHKNWKK
tara:strand:- start:17506 stop:17820 length:315 start_codon:yes stop_codon:yes gene_type:complete